MTLVQIILLYRKKNVIASGMSICLKERKYKIYIVKSRDGIGEFQYLLTVFKVLMGV